MLFAYVDESNQGDYVSFGALVAEPDVVKSLTTALNKVVDDAFWRYGVNWNTELHGYELFQGTDGWKEVGARGRVRVYRAALEQIVGHDVSLIFRWCERDRLVAHQARKAYPTAWSPEQTVFQFLLQRIDSLAKKDEHLAMVIADMRDDREAHRQLFATYQRSGTPGDYMSTKLPAILDTVHFVPSHHSRMIQAADLVTYIHRRYSTIRETDPRGRKVMDEFKALLTNSDAMYGCGGWP